jgi:hypothetical protein
VQTSQPDTARDQREETSGAIRFLRARRHTKDLDPDPEQ